MRSVAVLFALARLAHTSHGRRLQGLAEHIQIHRSAEREYLDETANAGSKGVLNPVKALALTLVPVPRPRALSLTMNDKSAFEPQPWETVAVPSRGYQTGSYQDTKPQPSLSRRALLAAPLVAPPVAVAQASSPDREGMRAFAEGNVKEAIQLYDSVIEANPSSKPFLWQRGLALYYAERYADGVEQFAADVAVNPNDTEEQIWHLLCLAQIKGGLAAARPFKLSVGTDRRPVMRAVQKLFLSGDSADEVQLAAIARDGDAESQFYAALYLSLYHEALGNSDESRRRMAEAVGTSYARGGGRSDPMVELANVAYTRRGWRARENA